VESGTSPETAWRKALELFDEYLKLDEAEIEAGLRTMAVEDPETATRLRSLLKHDGLEEGILDRDVKKLVDELLPEEPPTSDATGRLIGKYRILHRVGEGGMGVVYEAERADGTFEQKVAVKLLKFGSETEDAMARFSRERQILARLEHPGITRLLDGGQSAEGRPFLVMELVEGQEVDAYCDQKQLSIEERLRLFIEICLCVHHAHGHLVVHRDLKPSNILIDAQGRPRLLDFGIAKLLAQEKEDGLTHIGQRIMTPEFAAPEQIKGETITTATDIYALGLILFELLAGKRMRTQDSSSENRPPQRPSSAVSSLRSTCNSTEKSIADIAACRKLSPRRLRHRLRGEIDLIVMKALRYQPEERYSSAAALAEDIRRHLNGFPILARNENVFLRIRAFLHRNRGAAAGGIAVLLALGLGLYSTLEQAHKKARQAEITQAVSEFLIDLFAGSDPTDIQNSDLTAMDLLNRGADRLDTDPRTPPEIRAELMEQIAGIYMHLGEFRKAVHFSGLALLKKQSLYGPDSPESAHVESLWGSCLWKIGNYRQAEATLRHTLALQKRDSKKEEISETLSSLGALYSTLGRYNEAAAAHQEALKISREIFGPESAQAAADLQNLGVVRWSQGRLGEAEKAVRGSQRIRLHIFGEDSVENATCLHNLASILSDAKKYMEAEECFRRAIFLREKIYRAAHPDLALSISGLSGVLMHEGKEEESLALAERAVEITRRIYGSHHTGLAIQLNNLGYRFYNFNSLDKAEACFREALEIWEGTLPSDHPNLTTALSNIGMILFTKGDLAKAEAFLRKSLTCQENSANPAFGNMCLSLVNLGRILDAEGKSEEALEKLEEARRIAEIELDPKDSMHETIHRRLLEIRNHGDTGRELRVRGEK